MFAASGKIGYEDLLRSLVSMDKDPADPMNRKALSQNTNSEYLRNLIISLIKGLEPRLMSLPPQWSREVNMLKTIIAREIQRVNLDPFRKSTEMADQCIKELFPYLLDPKVWDSKVKLQ